MTKSIWIGLALGLIAVPLVAVMKGRRWWVWLLVSFLVSPLVAFGLLIFLPPPGRPHGSAPALRVVPIFYGLLWMGLATFLLVRWWDNLWVRVPAFLLALHGLNSLRIGLFASPRALYEMQTHGGGVSDGTLDELDRYH